MKTRDFLPYDEGLDHSIAIASTSQNPELQHEGGIVICR